MKDDDKSDFLICGNPRRSNSFYLNWINESGEIAEQTWIGVDWAKGSGMNRGEVIKRDGNVTTVRFRPT